MQLVTSVWLPQAWNKLIQDNFQINSRRSWSPEWPGQFKGSSPQVIHRLWILNSWKLVKRADLSHEDPNYCKGIGLPIRHSCRNVVIRRLVMHQVQLCIEAEIVASKVTPNLEFETSLSYLCSSKVCSDPWPGWLPQWRWNWLRVYDSESGPPEMLAP